MTSLSPQAQAVLDAAYAQDHRLDHPSLAAALRAAADQVVPDVDPPLRGDFSDRSVYQWAVDCHAHDNATRHKLLAIAAELRGINTP